MTVRPLLPITAAATTAVLATVLGGPALAVVTSIWQVETYSQFDQGDATSAYITSLGEVRPGWDSKRTALEGDGVWSALRLADGSVLLGSDQDGALYQVRADKPAKVGAIAGAIAVVALTQGKDGVYAGAMPGDALWKIDLAGGKATAKSVAKLAGVETIWSLAVGADGTVWAGTGPDGKLFAIKGGSAREVFATDDKRITALLVAPDGAVWMGTSERAIVFRHDPKTGQTRAMADFAGNEISSLAAYRGGVVVAANDITDPAGGPGKSAATIEAVEKPGRPKGQAPKTPEAGSKPGADKDTSGAEAGRKGARKGKGALFRVGEDGALEQLHALTQTYFTAVAVGADGVIYAGAADKGRIFAVEPDGTVATAIDVDDRAVSQLWFDGKALTFTTDDSAALHRVTGRAAAAKYVSDVFDAKAVARFGRLTWQGAGAIKLETRTGNTAKPGAGWSEWAAPAGVGRIGGGTDGGKVSSPAGRYLQFRVALGDDAARVRRVALYYVPQNQATLIEEVTIEPASREALPTLKDLAAKPRAPVLRVKWKVDNTDGDDTSYLLDVRREGEANWRALATGKAPLTATSWEWTTETFPDGWYRLRVTGSDAGANSPDRALTSSKTSALFVIDNQRPTVEALAVTFPRARARASDALSMIAEAAFSIDDGPWQLATSADGIFDDLGEDLRIDLPADLAKGTHTLSIRVADAAGNVGSAGTTFVK